LFEVICKLHLIKLARIVSLTEFINLCVYSLYLSDCLSLCLLVGEQYINTVMRIRCLHVQCVAKT